MITRQDTHPHGEYLSAYLDGRLDVARTREIGTHLGRCAACAHQVARLDETRALLRRLPAPGADPEFWTHAYRRLRVDQHSRAARREGIGWGTDWGTDWGTAPVRRWAVGAAAVTALGLALTPLASSTFPRHAVAPTALIQPVRTSMPAADLSPDVDSLVASHTDSVSRLPLADSDRQKMIAADSDSTDGSPAPADSADGP